MSHSWLNTDVSANRCINTYIKGFVDVSGIVYLRENSSAHIGLHVNSHVNGTYLGIDKSNAAYKLDVNGEVGSTNFQTTSDSRIKTNKSLLHNAVSTLMKVTPQTYHKYSTFECEGEYVIESGVIAQEIYDVPELRHLVSGNGPTLDATSNAISEPLEADSNSSVIWGDEIASVNYNGFIAYLIKAIQELESSLQQEKSKTSSLEQRIQALEENHS